MSERITLSQELREALLNPDLLPTEIKVNGRAYVPQRPIAAGYKGAVWKVTDHLSRFRAAKLALYDDYEDRSFLKEIALAAKLEPYPEFARFDDADVIEVDLQTAGRHKFVCFIEEWIDGTPLINFLADKSTAISSAFLVQYVLQMCPALAALKAQGLQHDDLHGGNVMICSAPPGATELRVRVIDTGSLKGISGGTKKPKDDHRQFVDHIVSIYNRIRGQKFLRVRDTRFLAAVENLLHSMLDDDPTVVLRDPVQIADHFGLAFTRAERQDVATQTPSLLSPFEYISAEHIADDRLLVRIFAQSCPWLDKVAGADPCLLTGPRGCGKSTIFRWLSLKAHLHKETPEIPSDRIAGFYVSCSADLQNRLGWIRTQALADRFQTEIVHYFNLLLAHEIVQTLCLISDRPDAISFWGLGSQQQARIHEFIQSNVHGAGPALQGTSRIRQALDLIELAMLQCHAQILKGLNLSSTTPETFIGDFTTLLAREFPIFTRYRIAFLVDDFSTHRVPEPVQRILNRIIWERRSSHTFKLSSEKYGATLTGPDDATIDVTREMIEIDCGREYVALDDQPQVLKARTFAIDLLAHRLTAAEYIGTPETLLGSSTWTERSLARALRERQTGRKDDQYHGIDCIAALCSGDISALLLVYRRIFELGGVERTTASLVPKYLQHQAVESVSRELLARIKYVLPHGQQMYKIAEEFGRLVRRILDEGRLIKKGDSFVPPQCPRIEVDQGTSAEPLSSEQQALVRSLVRTATFIELEAGRSRHEVATTARWQLRRVLLPAFGAALAKNDALKWSISDLKFFLTDPRAACEAAWQKRQKKPDEGTNPTLPLKWNRNDQEE